MVDAIVAVVLEQLTSPILKEMEKEVKLVTGVEDEIQNLTTNFRAIQAVLFDAERRHINNKDKALGHWLDRLKDVTYDLDDVLDEWRTAILQSRSDDKVRFLYCNPRFCFSRVSMRRDIAIKVKRVNRKLDRIARERRMYNLDMSRISNEEVTRSKMKMKTTAFVDVSEVRGREIEKSDLLLKLLSRCHEEGMGIHVISVVGMAGIGKTTLAQLAYNDKEIVNGFDVRIWVCVSESFDEIRVGRAIIEALEGKGTDLTEFQSLLVRIRSSIGMKKFFLVLDDVWLEDGGKLKALCTSLDNGANGNKILVTTRKEKVARMMRSTDVISVGRLSDEESWLLFKELAFCDRSVEDCEKLEKYGRRIVGRCKGLPLAVKTIGSLLHFKKMEQQWQTILDNEMWNLEELEENVFAPLLLSYNDLSSMVKQCFAYCAIFPKGYALNKNDLIRLWMAQGYLLSNKNTQLEIVGEECFDNLAMHSLFQEFKKDKEGNIMSCKMHDVVHEFAQYIARKECLVLELSDSDIFSQNLPFETSRHLRLMLNVESEASSYSFKTRSILKLRSFFLSSKDSFSISHLLPSLFKQLTCLRAVTLDRNLTGEIPREVGQLIHLRYLNFSSLDVKQLPDELCDLYNLETLNIRNCVLLEKLPDGIGKLINLRHLLNRGTLRLRYMPKGIERLTCLQTLDEVVLGADPFGTKVFTLESLKLLNHLKGSLKISGLGNVKTEAEATKAKFQIKNSLINLNLIFDEAIEAQSSSVERMKKDAVVLEALEAPPSVERIQIQFYKSSTISLHGLVSLTQLKGLSLNHFANCEQLPPLGRFPSLESLDINGMSRLISVSSEFLGTSLSLSNVAFPKLIRLSFKDMPNWEDWDYKFTSIEEKDMIIMPALCYLEINKCFKLKGLPNHLVNAASHTLQISLDGQSTLLRKPPETFQLPPIDLVHQRLRLRRHA